MKTSININLFGTVYAIDEDAHKLLDQYLTDMKAYFGKQAGGDEIADDIEHRVAELFWELKQQGTESISIEQVTDIIHNIGNPEQMNNEEETENDGKKEDTTTTTEGITPNPTPSAGPRRYYRDPKDKILGGVLAGLCRYFGWSDPVVMRIIFVLLCFFTEGIFIWIYLLIWAIAPKATTAEERLKMQGKAVNPDNIRAEVLNNQQTPTESNSNGNGCLKGLLALLCAPFGCIAIFVVFILCIVFFALAAGMVGMFTGLTAGFMPALGDLFVTQRFTMIAAILCMILVIALPIYGLYRWFRRDTNPMSGTTTLIIAGCWLIALILCCSSVSSIKNKVKELDWSTTNWPMITFTDDDTVYIESEEIGTEEFSAIKMEGVGTLYFTQADSCSYDVQGDSTLLNKTQVTIDNGVLSIITQGEIKGNNHGLKVYASAPLLTAANLRGVGSIEFKDSIRFDNDFCLAMEGVGAIKADYIECPKLSLQKEGVGAATICLKSESLQVTSKGVGAVTLSGETMHYEKLSDGFINKINDKGLKVIE